MSDSQVPYLKLILDDINVAFQGLYYPSEAEFPWDVRIWAGREPTLETLRADTFQPPDVPIRTMPPAVFLQQLERRCQGYGPEGRITFQRHLAAIDIYMRHFRNVTIYRLGKQKVTILLLGKLPPHIDEPEIGAIGLETHSIET